MCSFVKRSGRGAPPAAPDAAAACLATARTLTTWPLSVEGSEPVLAVDRYSIIGQLGGTDEREEGSEPTKPEGAPAQTTCSRMASTSAHTACEGEGGEGKSE